MERGTAPVDRSEALTWTERGYAGSAHGYAAGSVAAVGGGPGAGRGGARAAGDGRAGAGWPSQWPSGARGLGRGAGRRPEVPGSAAARREPGTAPTGERQGGAAARRGA